MFVSIRTYRFASGSIDDLMHRIDVGIADAFAQEEGFIGYEVAQIGERMVATITTFAEPEQAEASNQRAAEWVAEELPEFGIERIGVVGGEVMVSRASADMLVPAHH